MSRNLYLIALAVALVVAGAFQVASNGSVAHSQLSTSPRIDAAAITLAAENLPSQHFDHY